MILIEVVADKKEQAPDNQRRESYAKHTSIALRMKHKMVEAHMEFRQERKGEDKGCPAMAAGIITNHKPEEKTYDIRNLRQ